MNHSNILFPLIPIAKRTFLADESGKQPSHNIENCSSENLPAFTPCKPKGEQSSATQKPTPSLTPLNDDFLQEHSSNELSDSLTVRNPNSQNVLMGVISHLNEEVKRMQLRMGELENRLEGMEESSEQRAKKRRRRAEDVEKTYSCPYDNCQKSYGTEVSLNLHIKLKHNGGTKTERQQLLRLKTAGKDVEARINLPPEPKESFKENAGTVNMG